MQQSLLTCCTSLVIILQSEAEASYYHTHKLISTASLDGQTVQSDVLYTGKLETRFKNHPKNKTGAGILVSRLKEDGGLPTKVMFCTCDFHFDQQYTSSELPCGACMSSTVALC